MARTSEEQITLEVKKGIALITLNIPTKLNAMSFDLYVKLAAILNAVNSRKDTHITILTGKGSFFSAGADVKNRGFGNSTDEDTRSVFLKRLSAGNMELAKSLYDHKKILIAALNGPVIGLSAGMLGWFDFIYSVDNAWLLTPFSTIGLVAEGGSSWTFSRRMGVAKANEALILGKKMGANELLACGFINKLFPAQPQESFIASVLTYVQEKFAGLDKDAILITKQLIKESLISSNPDSSNLREVMAGADRFGTGKPQEQFARLASGELKHKL